MTALESRFWAALQALERWYADPIKAAGMDRTSSSKPGSVILRVGRYPDADQWRYLWRTARTDEQREAIVEDMELEHKCLGRALKSFKHHVRRDTVEWKTAIATCDLAPKETARLYGVGLSTVYKYRKEFGQVA